MADPIRLSILVPFRGDGGQRDRLWKWCYERWEEVFPDAEIVVADSGDEPFNRGKSRNLAAEQATGNVFLIADADGANDNVYSGMMQAHHNGEWVICYSAPDGYIGLTEEATDLILRADRAHPLPEPPPACIMVRCHSYAGAIVCRADDFRAIGGYDPRFTGWGYEDDAFRAAMTAFFGEPRRTGGFHLHLWHEHVESERFAQPEIFVNAELAARYAAAQGSRDAMMSLIRERS